MPTRFLQRVLQYQTLAADEVVLCLPAGDPCWQYKYERALPLCGAADLARGQDRQHSVRQLLPAALWCVTYALLVVVRLTNMLRQLHTST